MLPWLEVTLSFDHPCVEPRIILYEAKLLIVWLFYVFSSNVSFMISTEPSYSLILRSYWGVKRGGLSCCLQEGGEGSVWLIVMTWIVVRLGTRYRHNLFTAFLLVRRKHVNHTIQILHTSIYFSPDSSNQTITQSEHCIATKLQTLIRDHKSSGNSLWMNRAQSLVFLVKWSRVLKLVLRGQ